MTHDERIRLVQAGRLIQEWRVDAKEIRSGCDDKKTETVACDACEWQAKGLEQCATQLEAILDPAAIVDKLMASDESLAPTSEVASEPSPVKEGIESGLMMADALNAELESKLDSLQGTERGTPRAQSGTSASAVAEGASGFPRQFSPCPAAGTVQHDFEQVGNTFKEIELRLLQVKILLRGIEDLMTGTKVLLPGEPRVEVKL